MPSDIKHCHHCRKDFATPSSLKRHFSAKHPGEIDGRREKDKRHACPQCQEDFTRRESLRRHIRSKHDHDLSLCSFCLKHFRADYMPQHRSRCAKRYLKKVQQHANLDDNAGAAQFEIAPKSIRLGPHVSPGQNTLHLNGGGLSKSRDEGCTLRVVHEHVYDARLAEDALTCALLSFEEADDVRAYEEALAIALRLNIPIYSRGIRPRERRAHFRDLATFATAIEGIIRGHSTIDDTYEYNETILHLACAAGFAGLLEPLFWRGASFDTIDDDDETPLACAVRSGDLDTVIFALALGSDPNTGYNLGLTLTSVGHHRIMTALVEHGADINQTFRGWTILEDAIDNADVDDVRFVLSLGADPSISTSRHGLLTRVMENCEHSDGDSCQCGDIALVLLEHGVDIPSQDAWEDTIFHFAVFKTHVRLLRAALTKITSPLVLSAIDVRTGMTALHLAVSISKEELTHRKVKMASMLLEAGSHINARTAEGYSALELAAAYGCEEVVKLLLDAGAEVNAPSDHRFPALMLAADSGEEGIVRLLINAGADVNSQDKDGESALVRAAAEEHESIVRLLLDARADVDLRNERGETALIAAVKWGHKGITRLLLNAGADVYAETWRGETALAISHDRFDWEVAELLIEAGAVVDPRK